MSVVLTGDVHHYIRSSDQLFGRESEAAIAVEYAKIADRYGLKVTLFVTGHAIIENSTDSEPLVTMNNVEIGGHGWDAFRPRVWHGLLSRLIGSPHGPPKLQQRMIQRTCRQIELFAGNPVRSWRNHAYRYDQQTPLLLANAGIEVWSDKVELAKITPYRHASGVSVLPINTLPDHENLYHGKRTPVYVAEQNEHPSYTPKEWCDIVCDQVEKVVSNGGTATILAHPICMQIADEWVTFERLCAFLSNYTSLFAREAG